MRPSFPEYFQTSWSNFREAVLNLLIFFPYFFSVKALLKTLFEPWKNIQSEKKERGFSFSGFFDRLAFDMISRGMGFAMRSSILLFYVIFALLFPPC